MDEISWHFQLRWMRVSFFDATTNELFITSAHATLAIGVFQSYVWMG